MLALSASTNQGLKSDALRVALLAALAGKPAVLEDLMCRMVAEMARVQICA